MGSCRVLVLGLLTLEQQISSFGIHCLVTQDTGREEEEALPAQH